MSEMLSQFANAIMILLVTVMAILILIFLGNRIASQASQSVSHYTTQERNSTITTTWSW